MTFFSVFILLFILGIIYYLHKRKRLNKINHRKNPKLSSKRPFTQFWDDMIPRMSFAYSKKSFSATPMASGNPDHLTVQIPVVQVAVSSTGQSPPPASAPPASARTEVSNLRSVSFSDVPPINREKE
jgi:hypothetical protein